MLYEKLRFCTEFNFNFPVDRDIVVLLSSLLLMKVDRIGKIIVH